MITWLVWPGLSLEGGGRGAKREKERKKVGNCNFGNAPVVYAELFMITVVMVYLLITYTQGISNGQGNSKRIEFFIFIKLCCEGAITTLPVSSSNSHY